MSVAPRSRVEAPTVSLRAQMGDAP